MTLDLTSIGAVALDMDGVLWRSSQVMPGIPGFFDFLQQHGIAFAFATNNSTTSVEAYVERLRAIGIPARAEQVVTSAVATADYYDHPSFAGTYITDEPGTDQYAKWAEICKAYRRDTQGKLPYINLLPMYANAAQLKFGAHAAAIEYYDPDPALYKKYCDSFCQMFDDVALLRWFLGMSCADVELDPSKFSRLRVRWASRR